MQARAAAPAGAPPRSLLLVTVDTLRSDHLSGYGHPVPLTPHLDRLSRTGETFTQVRTVAPLTLPAHASMLTGELPREHGVRNNGAYRLPPSAETLAERLRARGYVTGAFVSSYVLHRSFGLDQGFDAYDDVAGVTTKVGPELHSTARAGSLTVERALAWISARRAGQPLFLWVHLFEPHVPYEPPAPFDAFGGGDGYEGEVATADHEAARLLRALRRRGEPVDVWVTADHGESLGEHGEPTHGTFLYDATLLVPLIASRGGAARLERESHSIAEIRDWMLGKPGPAPEVVAESLSPKLDLGWSPLAALVEGGRKLVLAPRPEIYDLDVDPGELRDLASTSPAAIAALRARLGPYVEVAPSGAAAIPAESREALESLGYLGGSSSGRSAARAKDADPKDMVALLPFLASDAEGMEQAIDAFLEKDPSNPLVRLRKAWFLLSTGRRELAEREFAALAAEGLQGSAPHQGLAACRSEAKDWMGALAHLGRAASRDPGDRTIPFNRGQILLYLGRGREAIPELESVVDDDAVGPQAAAAIWMALRSTTGATSAWSVEREVDPARLRAVAAAARQAGAADVAGALEGRAGDVARLDAAELLARARREPERADGYLGRALELAPDDPQVVAEAVRRAEAQGDADRAAALRRRLAVR